MMYNLLRVLVASTLLLTTSQAASPTKTLEGRLEYYDGTAFNLTARISLNHDEYTTYSQADGSFAIYNVPPGIHQIDIHSHSHHFGQVKVQLLEDRMDEPNCLEYPYPGAAKQVTSYPLVLHPHATYEYFEKKKGFSMFSILKNPMVIMMVMSAGLMFLMPKMMEGLDPEEKARMQQQMKNQQDPSKMMSQLWGDLTGAQEEPPKRQRRVKKE